MICRRFFSKLYVFIIFTLGGCLFVYLSSFAARTSKLEVETPLKFPSVYSDDRLIMEREKYNSSARIPSILHVTWQSEYLPNKSLDILIKWRKLHPTWTIVLWTDESMTKFVNIQNNKVIRDTFFNFKEIINKVDFMRYVILYYFGGVYADLDVIPLQSLDPIMEYHSCIVCRELQPNPVMFKLPLTYASNFLLMSRPYHPFWTFLIDFIARRVPSDLVSWTGPLAVTDALRTYEEIVRFRTRESAVYLAPAIYFSFPYPAKGDDVHLGGLENVNCDKLLKDKQALPFLKRMCRVSKEEQRIDYSDAYLHPRHFKDAFAQHHMTRTGFKSDPWMNTGGTSIWSVIPDAVVFGINETKLFYDRNFSHNVSALDMENTVLHRD